MSETFPLDMLLSLGLGMSFSLGQGEKETNKNSVFATTYFRVGLAYHLVVAVGVAFVCYLVAPDWMWMYYTGRKRVPRSMVAYVFSGYVAMYVLGFTLVPHLRKVRKKAPWAAFAVVMGSIFAFIALTMGRLWYVGDVDAFERGEAEPITGTGLFWILLVAMPSAVGGLLGVLKALKTRFEVNA